MNITQLYNDLQAGGSTFSIHNSHILVVENPSSNAVFASKYSSIVLTNYQVAINSVIYYDITAMCPHS
jgi:hypothetical protein